MVSATVVNSAVPSHNLRPHSPVGTLPVSIIDLLESVTVPNNEHRLISASDTPTVRQIKSLNMEILALRKELDDKNKGLEANLGNSRVSPVLANTTWRDKVASSAEVSPRMKLEFFPPSVEGQKVKVAPPVSVAEIGAAHWKDCIVGYFVDKRLPYQVVRSMAVKMWSKYGLHEVLSNDKGFFFLLFESTSAYRQILETGPWHFGGKLMILQQWYPQMELEKVGLTKVPLWIQIFNIPLEYWNAQGLSYIASAVGRPLYADELTETNKRIRFASVCVEVEVDSLLPGSIELQFANGSSVDLVVKYPWKPLLCCKCKVFGHSDCSVAKEVGPVVENAEPKHVAKVWVVEDGPVPKLNPVAQSLAPIGNAGLVGVNVSSEVVVGSSVIPVLSVQDGSVLPMPDVAIVNPGVTDMSTGQSGSGNRFAIYPFALRARLA